VNEKYRNREQELLDEKYIKNVLRDLNDLGFTGIISFSGCNEPLLDNRISDGALIRLCKQVLGNKIKTLIITNGDLLTNSILDCMITSGLDLLEVSCYEDKILEKAKNMYESYKDKINFTLYDYRNSSVLRHNHGGGIQWGDEKIPDSCFMPILTSKIRSDGKVCLCIFETQCLVDLGNIKETPYKDLLKSDTLNLLRRKIAISRKGIQPCDCCNFSGIKKEICESLK
jgi:MoaA/NifB/PqqE/SkfB family radical SAM enzyme